MSRVSVIGLGHVGLPTAALLARSGLDVVGVDTDPAVVDLVNRGGVHISEPGLAPLVAGMTAAGRLRAVARPEPADAFLVTVPTPVVAATRVPDLRHVEAAFGSLAPVLRRGDVVILESTCPVGTTERMARLLSDLRPDLTAAGGEGGEGPGIQLAFCPERVMPGRSLAELAANPRVIGGMTPAASERASEIYRAFVTGDLRVTDTRTAEMVKLAENAFRDVNLAFANELSLLCHELGLDVRELVDLANRHPRVSILEPGPGVGGHCVPVDPWFLISAFPDLCGLLRTAREVNDAKPDWVVRRVLAARDARLAHSPGPVRLAVLGLAYKPNTSDVRESPACRIASRLAGEDFLEIRLVEPHLDQPPAELADFPLRGLDDALRGADIVLILVGHDRFRGCRDALETGRTVIDCVGLLD